MSRRFSPLSALLVLLLLSAGCSQPEGESAASLRRLARERLAQIDGALSVPGLEQPVEVLRDEWGVAHIYAKTVPDLFFAQGFVAAQDRLYQIEIWRRTGAGELAEVFGEDYIERDRIARLVRYRGDMDEEWLSYSPDAKQIAEAFTAGINAFIELRRDRLPIEFELLDFEPGRWAPEDVLLRIAGLMMVRNARQEIARAELIARLGVEATERFMPTDPVRRLRPDPELDLAGLDRRVLAGYRGAVSIPRLDPPQGSNNWTVSGKLSATGKPLLASDPHRPVILPSLRYLVHLNAPGWNVIGSGEPALPGVAIGHNERAGWGFTIVQYDMADLYVERLDPSDPTRYLYQGEPVEIDVEREQVRVRGRREPVEVELKFTRHGPVIWEDPERNRVVALRWAGQEPGTAGYLGCLAVDRVGNWDEFVEAMKRWKLPSENIVYADVDGDIGWIAAGLAPIRENWSGILPVPGHTGEYEWKGFRTIEELPWLRNPESGYIATANHNILPEGYAHELGFDWSAPYRFERLDEVLREGSGFTIEDFKRLQHDETSLPARRLTALLEGLAGDVGGATGRAKDELTSWDLTMGRDSGPAALFELWMGEVRRRWVATAVAEPARDLVAANLALPTLFRELESMPAAELRPILLDSLAAAAEKRESLFGAEAKDFRWGKLHTITFRHPLADSPARAEVFNRGPFERGGHAYTVNATPGPGYRQANGASYRHILDFSDWDNSVFTSTPGQSGQPESPYYDDLAPLWSEGRYAPLLFSREAVEAGAAHRLVLEPE